MENITQTPNLQPVQPVEPISPIKNQNIFKYLFIASIIVLLGVIIGFYFILNNKIAKLSEEKNTEVTNQVTVQPTAEKISINPTPTEIDQTKELTTAINPNNNPNIKVIISKVLGNYATGMVGDANGGGAGWIAVKVDGIWKKVAEGQDRLSCNIVNQYQIPKEIYGECL